MLHVVYSEATKEYIGRLYRTSPWEDYQQVLLVFKEKDQRGETGRRLVTYQWRDPKWKRVEAIPSDFETVKEKITKTEKEAEELETGRRGTRGQKPVK